MLEAEPREAAGTAHTAEIFRFDPTLCTRAFNQLFDDISGFRGGKLIGFET